MRKTAMIIEEFLFPLSKQENLFTGMRDVTDTGTCSSLIEHHA